MMLHSDPNRPCYRFDVRITRVGDKVAAYCAQLPSVTSLGKDEREAVNAICRQVSIEIRECRKKAAPIPWQHPARPLASEANRTVSVNMPTREEEMYRDEDLRKRLKAWAKKGSTGLKQQRRVATRLHELGFAAEAQAVLRHSWLKWADAAMVMDHMDAEGVHVGVGELSREEFSRGKKEGKTRLQHEFAEFSGDHPIALMRKWWLDLHVRMNAEWHWDHPSLVDDIDLQNYEAKQKRDLRDCQRVYHGTEEEVRQRVDILTAHDAEKAKEDAEQSKARVAAAARSERDGAAMREIAEDLKVAEVMTRIEEKKREQ